ESRAAAGLPRDPGRYPHGYGHYGGSSNAGCLHWRGGAWGVYFRWYRPEQFSYDSRRCNTSCLAGPAVRFLIIPVGAYGYKENKERQPLYFCRIFGAFVTIFYAWRFRK